MFTSSSFLVIVFWFLPKFGRYRQYLTPNLISVQPQGFVPTERLRLRKHRHFHGLLMSRFDLSDRLMFTRKRNCSGQ